MPWRQSNDNLSWKLGSPLTQNVLAKEVQHIHPRSCVLHLVVIASLLTEVEARISTVRKGEMWRKRRCILLHMLEKKNDQREKRS